MKVYSNVLTSRINVNLPVSLIERVEAYRKLVGVNKTNAYIFLLTSSLDYFEKNYD